MCIIPECQDRNYVDKNGVCNLCEEYKITASNKKECEHPSCWRPPNKGEHREFVKSDGSCHPCDDFMITKEDKKSC